MEYFEQVIANGGNLASPNLFALTLPNIFLGEAAIRFGLTGPGFAVNCSAAGGDRRPQAGPSGHVPRREPYDDRGHLRSRMPPALSLSR